jgi:flagellar biosynthesis protein
VLAFAAELLPVPDDPDMAVALKYDREQDQAPRVVAKGLRLKAEKIKALAKQYDIPVMKNTTLAEALYRVDVGQEIPEELYDAVAEVLNFVYALQQETKKER